MDYDSLLKHHLAGYKRDVLHEPRDGLWGLDSQPRSHILPKDVWDLNLVAQIRAAYAMHTETQPIRRHRDFHHLNSSQAFALNLLFPCLTCGSIGQDVLLAALGLPPARIQRWQFEAIRDQDEYTNFDLWFDLGEQGQVFFEVKLSEKKFKAEKPTSERLNKIATLYRPRLQGRTIQSKLSDVEILAAYQLFRNYSYADIRLNHTVVLLFPRANNSIARDARRFIAGYVPESARSTIRPVFAEDVFRNLIHDVRLPSEARGALLEVGMKYQLGGGVAGSS